MRASLLSPLLTLFVMTASTQAAPPLTRYHFDEPLMGTRFRIVLYAPEPETAQRAAKAAYRRGADLNEAFSDYKADSELMLLCQKSGGSPVTVSEDLFTVLNRAQTVAEMSGGAFDVTIGPVVRLWRRARRTRQLPEAADLADARARMGYPKVKLDPEKKTVQLLQAGMLLDLGGIAKGYTADQMLLTLRRHGILSALVAAGGDITVSARPPDAEGWTVAIAPLLDPTTPPRHRLLLEHAAVSTSGDAEQFVEIGGRRYSHIVDPRTGVGLVGRMSATVVARDGITADSLTKVIAILGPEKGFPMIEKTPGVSGYFVRKTDSGEDAIASPRFQEVPKAKDPKPGS